ncbi:MAG: hypothetical protein H8E00_00160 [Deltaproteobacteria bacterium]|nr:hypothetical protein [Deltaproteobacteria bacterium]
MSFSLKSLAKACIDAETGYAVEEIPLAPRFVLTIRGKRSDEKVLILSGLEGRGLFGDHMMYMNKKKMTLVLVKCSHVRDFFSQGGWTPEGFLEEEKPVLH